jgi:hypothetical protein
MVRSMRQSIDLTEAQIREVAGILTEKLINLRRDISAYKLIPKKYRSKRLRLLTKEKRERLKMLRKIHGRFER